MASRQEGRKLYLKAPDLEFVPNGPIKIGNVITDMFLPQDPIAFLKPLSDTMKGAGAGEGNRERDNSASSNVGLAAKLYEAFGGRAEAKGSRNMWTVYDYERIESWYPSRYPTAADVKVLRKEDDEVRGALNSGPIYVVTGLKVARGLRYSNRRSHVNEYAAMEGWVGGARGGKSTESFRVIGDCILAYRLHIIQGEGRRRRGPPSSVQVRTYDPGNAGFMNRDDVVQDVELEAAEVTQEDVKFFADEEEYGDILGVDVQDEEEAWSMLLKAE